MAETWLKTGSPAESSPAYRDRRMNPIAKFASIS
jgi:hypothetical protein